MYITLIGGPTALLEIDGLRILTDPTFDAPGSEFVRGAITLRKTTGPALSAAEVMPVDAVLLSHDQHFDNLDHAGRALLPEVRAVFTTPSGAERLRGNAVGLKPWQSSAISSEDGAVMLHVTATPARHGPPGIEPLSGEVVGFVLQSARTPDSAIYVTGDTVWYEGVAEVAHRFPIRTIILFAGAARVKDRGPAHLTMNHEDALATASAFPEAHIYPVHYEGWEHFSEGAQILKDTFTQREVKSRLHILDRGKREELQHT